MDSEIKSVPQKIDNVRKDSENELNSKTKDVSERMKERINARVIQNKKELDQEEREVTAASTSQLASVKEHKVTLNYLGKTREYVNSTFDTVSGKITETKQHHTAEISKFKNTLSDL